VAKSLCLTFEQAACFFNFHQTRPQIFTIGVNQFDCMAGRLLEKKIDLSILKQIQNCEKSDMMWQKLCLVWIKLWVGRIEAKQKHPFLNYPEI
jgi:hypothetical protein